MTRTAFVSRSAFGVWIGTGAAGTGLAIACILCLAGPAGVQLDSRLLGAFGAGATLLSAILLVASAIFAPSRSGLLPADATVTSAELLEPLALAVLNHELRTPLNAIIGFAGLMRSLPPASADPARYGDYARMIEASGEHMLAVLEASLGAHAAKSAAREIESGPLDLEGALSASLEILAPAAAVRNVSLCLVQPVWPSSVCVEWRALQQILINLLSNAVKYSEPGMKVNISIRQHGPDQVEIAIQDRGMGMSATDLEQIGQPHLRTHEARRRKIEGTGLGLAISRQLAREQGAHLALESQVGAGTTARLYLPALTNGPVDWSQYNKPRAVVAPSPRTGTSANRLLTHVGQ